VKQKTSAVPHETVLLIIGTTSSGGRAHSRRVTEARHLRFVIDAGVKRDLRSALEPKRRIAELEAELAARDARIAEQDARIEAQVRQVAELTDHLGRNSGNSAPAHIW